MIALRWACNGKTKRSNEEKALPRMPMVWTLDMSKFIPILYYAWNDANAIFFSPIKSTFTYSFYLHWVKSFLVSTNHGVWREKIVLFLELIIAPSSELISCLHKATSSCVCYMCAKQWFTFIILSTFSKFSAQKL